AILLLLQRVTRIDVGVWNRVGLRTPTVDREDDVVSAEAADLRGFLTVVARHAAARPSIAGHRALPDRVGVEHVAVERTLEEREPLPLAGRIRPPAGDLLEQGRRLAQSAERRLHHDAVVASEVRGTGELERRIGADADVVLLPLPVVRVHRIARD